MELIESNTYTVKYRLKVYSEHQGVITSTSTEERSCSSNTEELHYIFRDLCDLHKELMVSGLEIIEINPSH